MMFRPYFIAFLVLISNAAASAQEITFVLRANASQICLTDSLKISYRISGYDQLKVWTKLSKITGFELLQGPDARQTENVRSNKRGGYDTVRSYEAIYTLRPLATGQYTLPALTATLANGKVLQSNTLQLKVIRDCRARIIDTSFGETAGAAFPFMSIYVPTGDTSKVGKLQDELRRMANGLLYLGEVITEPRNVYITFYCKTADSRAACMQWAQQQGFRIPNNSDLDGADEHGEYLLWIARKEVAIPDKIFPVVQQIIQKVEERFTPQVRYKGVLAQQLKAVR